MPHTHSSGCHCHRPLHQLLKVLLGIALVSMILTGLSRAQDATPPDQNAGQTVEQPAPEQRPQGRVVRLRYVEGDVQVLGGDQTQFDRAVANMPLAQGFVIQTGSDGKAELQFEDGSIARIVPGSYLAINTLAGTEIGNLQTGLELRAGTGYFEVDPTGNDVFEVDAGGLVLTVPNKGSFRVDMTGDGAQIAVADGAISLQDGNNSPVTVNANQTAYQQVSGVTVSPGTSTESYDQWNEDRDQVLQQQASASSDSQQGGDASGWADLDYYGNWYPVPGVGNVWQPYGYGDSFDPYDGGYWAYYPWGYSWVSAYPWGWTPFHCGYWGYYNSFGWGWVPGGCGVGIWYPWTPVHNPPHGWRPPHRPGRPSPEGPRLIAVGKAQGSGLHPLPAHPAPHPVNAKPVTINGHTVQPVFAAPRSTMVPARIPGGAYRGPSATPGNNSRPPVQRSIASSPWHGSAPMPPRNQPHAQSPPRGSSPPHVSAPPPSHPSGSGAGSHH